MNTTVHSGCFDRITRAVFRGAAVAAAALAASCGQCPRPAAVVIGPELRAHSQIPDATAMACAKCHQKEYGEWLASHHAHAERLVDATSDATAFTPARVLTNGSFVTKMRKEDGNFVFTESVSNGPPANFHVEAVIGVSPLRQYLVTGSGGRLQTEAVAYDPRSNEWFNAQGTENRQPHEWGFWTNRSMVWNVQCASCHTTGLKKNYDAASDTYATTWDAMGVSCLQCHAAAAHPATNGCPVCAAPEITTNLAAQNCASCHARREDLTGRFRPGEKFDDHFRLTLPDDGDVFYADGQVRGEDFEYTSFRLSRMGNKGVTCLDCHNPHSGKIKLPVDDNELCLQCHIPPGLRGAIPVDPVNHSHHAPGTAGSRCVDCHMPVTMYMVRHARRDHSFTTPDPELTIELGIPNACNRCHTDKTAQWADEYTRKWYGEKMDRPSRRRARVIAAAEAGDPSAGTNLLALARAEEIPAWRATETSLLAPWAGRADVRDFLISSATYTDALVRSCAVRALQGRPAALPVFQKLLDDPSRLVRIDAALALPGTGDTSIALSAEVKRYLDYNSDEPVGALHRAQVALETGDAADAEKWARRAAEWDTSAAPQHALGRILYALGKTNEALVALEKAVALAPQNAGFHFDLALLYGELGRSGDTLAQLKLAVADDPGYGRAWYDLGLGEAQANDLDAAVTALEKAEKLMPGSPEPPYALATVLLRQNKPAAARAAAQRALQIAPDYAPALELLGPPNDLRKLTLSDKHHLLAHLRFGADFRGWNIRAKFAAVGVISLDVGAPDGTWHDFD